MSEGLTEAMKLNIKDSLERIMFLHKQMKAAMDYAPIRYVEGFTGEQIQIFGNESFENIRETYEVSEQAVVSEYWNGELHKHFPLNGFKICVVLNKWQDGFIPPKEGDTNAD